jgi:hypothetical protein
VSEVATVAQQGNVVEVGEAISLTSLDQFIITAMRDTSIDVHKTEALLRMRSQLIADDERIRREARDDQAQRALARAMADTAAELKPVGKDTEGSKGKYASHEAVDNEARPVYSKYGLYLTFRPAPPEQPGNIRMDCIVGHRDGASLPPISFEIPIDNSGAKTEGQARLSSTSYLHRYLKQLAFDIIRKDDDDDGASAGRPRDKAPAPPPPPPKPRRANLTPQGSPWVRGQIEQLNTIELSEFWVSQLLIMLEHAPTEADLDALLAAVKPVTGGALPASRDKIDLAVRTARAVFHAAERAKPAANGAAKAANPPFEAMLIDQFGEPAGATITDPMTFARTILAGWGELTPEQRTAMLEFNEGAIEEARQHPEAAAMLRELDEEPVPQAESRSESTGAKTVAVKPGRGGKDDWPGYVRDLKAAMEGVFPPDFPAWLEAQRATLAQAPIASRVLAVRAIVARAYEASVPTPSWLGESIRQDRPPNEDEIWAEKTIAEVQEIRTRPVFGTFVRNINPVMERLKREKPALAARVTAECVARQEMLRGAGT